MKKYRGENLLKLLRQGEPLTRFQQVFLTLSLSIPAILAQISSIIMQYIDASMVGQLGANDSASIGLVSSSTWLFSGLSVALVTGYTVQVAHSVGAQRDKAARNIMKQGFIINIGFSLVLLVIGVLLSDPLPRLLAGDSVIVDKASKYFLIYMLMLPIIQINNLSAGMLQASGDIKVPSILYMIMCILDVIFNAFFIFPSLNFSWGGLAVSLPGMGLGVVGAALGTACAELVIAGLMFVYLIRFSDKLRYHAQEKLSFSAVVAKQATILSLPLVFEQIVMCGAQIVSTAIVAPLGTIAIAANSFAITAESLCYMPGFGIEVAATTLIGQSIGAKRHDLIRPLAYLITGLGMTIMAISGIFLYLFAPVMLAILTPDSAIQRLGVKVLRIEAFAEPLFGASIVASGVFRGAGDTLVPSLMTFASMWLIRLPLAFFLASIKGLPGIWLAMCLELFIRGFIFLGHLKGKKWLKKEVIPLQE